MSAVGDWDAFAGALGLSPKATGDSTGSDWTLVFARRGRTLALPASKPADPESLDFFLNTASKWWWAQLSMWRQRLVPGSLPQTSLTAEQHRQLQCMINGLAASPAVAAGKLLAIQFGTRGPLQKVMVLGNDNIGRQRVVKVALRPSADERIVAEASYLARLAGYSGLAGHVPLLEATGQTPSGRPYFVMDAVIGEPTSSAFGAPHAELLRRIGVADYRIGAWQDCSLFQRIEDRLRSLLVANANDLAILGAGWSSACSALTNRQLPLCLNHGDFVAWNFLQTERGLIALDWEYAQEHANPLADYFHFHLITAALDGRLRKGRVQRDGLLANASRHAQETFGIDEDTAAAITAPLLLAYLVDTVSFYATESGGIYRNDPVVDSYLKFIEAQA